jgi:hypothetical protein
MEGPLFVQIGKILHGTSHAKILSSTILLPNANAEGAPIPRQTVALSLLNWLQPTAVSVI